MTSFFRRGGAKLGQHFLTNTTVAKTIASESGAGTGKTVLEIGPGKGVLTKEILALGASVVAVEKDTEMVRILEETFPAEIASGKLTIISGDARTFLTEQFDELHLPSEYSVAANIPYYITGELIRLFLTAPHQPSAIVLLMQKEVAERIARSEKESLLSLSVKAYGSPSYIQTVKAGNFNPPPKVDSAVLKIENISRDYFKDISEEHFFEMLHVGFGQKRKVLLGNLKRAYSDQVNGIWESLGLNTQVRAEDVPLQTWGSIAQKLTHT